MALPITDTQLTKLYIAAEETDVSTPALIATAISTADITTGIQTLGSVGSTRNVTEYSALDVDDTSKSLGSLSLGNIPLSLLFDSTDTAGQAELRTMYSTNSRRVFIIKLTDDLAVSPSYLTFDGAISEEMYPIEKDAAVLYDTVVEITSAPVFTAATAV